MAKRASKEDRFLEMRIAGMSFQAISEELSVSKQTLINWSKDTEIQEAVSIGRMMRLQAIVKKYEIDREASLTRYCMLQRRCLTELGQRDLSDLPTDKLVKIILSMDKRISEIIPEPVVFQEANDFEIPFGEESKFVLDLED